MRDKQAVYDAIATRRKRTFRIVWNGIDIRIRYTWKYFGHGGAWQSDTTDHIEVDVAIGDTPFCPITVTGYRSYFVPTRNLRALGGPVAYIEADLARMSKDPKWLQASFKARQLDLFRT